MQRRFPLLYGKFHALTTNFTAVYTVVFVKMRLKGVDTTLQSDKTLPAKLNSMKTVSVSAFRQALAEGAAAFDTRASARYQQDGLSGVAHLPLEAVQAGALPDVPKEAAVYLICERGQMSELAGLYLEAAGFSEVYNVAGGMLEWRRDEEVKKGGLH